MNKHGFIRVGACSPKLKVADVNFNVNQIIEQIEVAKASKVKILAFPELAITTYTCADLFHQDILIEKSLSGLNEIVKASVDADMVIIVGMPLIVSSMLFNAAVVVFEGRILGVIPKTFIPNSKEFYETRWFVSSRQTDTQELDLLGQTVLFGKDILFRFGKVIFGVEICEDLWALTPPSNHLLALGANLIFNLSASNEVIGKKEYRKSLVKMQSAKGFCGYVYSSCGASESTTDLIFSGHLMIAENGVMLKKKEDITLDSALIFTDVDIAKMINEKAKNNSYLPYLDKSQHRIVDFAIKSQDDNIIRTYEKKPFVPSDKNELDKRCNEILNMQSYALAKRVLHLKYPRLVIGVSGGVDSALALLVSVRAMGILNRSTKDIIAVTMPGFGTTNQTYNSSHNLIKILGATFREISIKKAVNQHFQDISHDKDSHDITYENAQARERTQILMDLANKEGGIVVGTGNLSEIALGWSTYNGDHMSMYAVNSSIPKTLVKSLINFEAEQSSDKEKKKVLQEILNTPISPELLPPDKNGEVIQKTEESIGDYIIHDFFLYHFFTYGAKPIKLLEIAKMAFADDYDETTIRNTLKKFLSRFLGNQFKRNCMPDGVKVGTVSLSPRGDFRMPSDAECKIWLDSLED